ncbi:MAG: aminodeoxychorismate/anthranilate synthase component II [Saprospiraceae bacterium]
MENKKKILIIDNYDSFTYNLVHLIEEIIGYDVTVWRNDLFEMEDVDEFDILFFSPGPGIPDEGGQMKEVINRYKINKPMMGICLGHQAIGECFGAEIKNMPEVYHGVMTPLDIIYKDSKLFENVSSSFEGGRYHSWVIEKDTLPREFIISSEDSEGQIMAIEHKTLPIVGVQFHPESILTPEGKQIITNFLKYYS